MRIGPIIKAVEMSLSLQNIFGTIYDRYYDVIVPKYCK